MPSGYRIPPDIERQMKALIDDGEFVNRADIMSTALRFWLVYRDIGKAVAEYLESPEGMDLLRTMVKRVRKPPKKE